MRCSELTLREAQKSDCRFIWELANDSQVRAVSFSSEEIPWEEHQKWYQGRLAEENCLFYIAENANSERLGQIRFELKNGNWVISLSIVEEFRGFGIGEMMIRTGSEMIFSKFPEAKTINAFIKNENKSSIHVFEKCGYKFAGKKSINRKNDAVLMVLQKSATG